MARRRQRKRTFSEKVMIVVGILVAFSMVFATLLSLFQQ
jgi:hypothetical protein